MLTVGDCPTGWLADRKVLSAGTRRICKSHLRTYLTPHLGAIRLDQLRVSHLAAVFTAIAVDAEDCGVQ